MQTRGVPLPAAPPSPLPSLSQPLPSTPHGHPPFRTPQKTRHCLWKFHIPPFHSSLPWSCSKHYRIFPISRMGKLRLRGVLILHKNPPFEQNLDLLPASLTPKTQLFSPEAPAADLSRSRRGPPADALCRQQGQATAREVPQRWHFPQRWRKPAFPGVHSPRPRLAVPCPWEAGCDSPRASGNSAPCLPDPKLPSIYPVLLSAGAPA